MLLRRPASAVVVALLLLVPAAAVSQEQSPEQSPAQSPAADDAVLAEGPPPLKQKLVDDFAAYLEWILDLELTEGQRGELRDLMVDVWEQQDQDSMRGVRSLARKYKEVAALDQNMRDFAREENQPAMLKSVRSASDPASKWTMAVYEAAHRPIADGQPPLTRQMADAQLEVLCFMAAVVRGAQPAELPKAVKDAWAEHLAAGWAELTGEQRTFVAGMPRLWAAMRAGWPLMPDDQKQQYRRQWKKELAPLLAKMDQPAPRARPAQAAGGAGNVKDAVDRAFEETAKKTRALEEKMKSGDPAVAQKAALEQLYHQQATYEMINNMSRMQFQTSQAIIYNMGSGWTYEYRRR